MAPNNLGIPDGVDGSMEVCIVCEEIGELICCDACPRAYHERCITDQGCTPPPVDDESDWTDCPGCLRDRADSQFAELAEKWRQGGIKDPLGLCGEAVKILTSHELCKPFCSPVNKKNVPGYYEEIKKPMDFGTIKKKLERGAYKKLNEPKPTTCNKEEESSAIDHGVAAFCQDVRQIWFNCKLYNTQGSAMYRIGAGLSFKFEKEFLEPLLIDSVNRETVLALAKAMKQLYEDLKKSQQIQETSPPTGDTIVESENESESEGEEFLVESESFEKEVSGANVRSSTRINRPLVTQDNAAGGDKNLSDQDSVASDEMQVDETAGAVSPRDSCKAPLGRRKKTNCEAPTPSKKPRQRRKLQALQAKSQQGEQTLECGTPEKGAVVKLERPDKVDDGMHLGTSNVQSPPSQQREGHQQRDPEVGDLVKALYDEDWWFGYVKSVSYDEETQGRSIMISFCDENSTEETLAWPGEDLYLCEEKELKTATNGKRYAWEKAVEELSSLLPSSHCSMVNDHDLMKDFEFEEKVTGTWWYAKITDVDTDPKTNAPIFMVQYLEDEEGKISPKPVKKMLQIIKSWRAQLGRLSKQKNTSQSGTSSLASGLASSLPVIALEDLIVEAKKAKDQQWKKAEAVLQSIGPCYKKANEPYSPANMCGFSFKEYIKHEWYDCEIIRIISGHHQVLTGPLYVIEYVESKERYVKRTMQLKDAIVKSRMHEFGMDARDYVMETAIKIIQEKLALGDEVL